MERREFCNVWSRYAATAFGLIYPVPQALAFVGGPSEIQDLLGTSDPAPILDMKMSPNWPIKGRVMNGPEPLTGWFPLHNNQYELKIGKMRPCYISAMDYRIMPPIGGIHELYVEVDNPQEIDDMTNVFIRFNKKGIYTVEGFPG